MLYSVQFSAGLSSWLAARRCVARFGAENVRLVFCDTIVEDEDAYRFLIEGAADVFSLGAEVIGDLARHCLSMPKIEDGRLEERKSWLAEIRREAMQKIPRLTWLCEGRTPWEVFQGVRFLGNSRVDPCSRVLKREISDRWHQNECDPASTTRVYGLTYAEQNRINLIRSWMSEQGWLTLFPMDDPPYLSRIPMMQAAIDRGIQPPRLYYLGFPHNNCGGLCCKMGQGQAARAHDALPKRYAYWEKKEIEFQEFIGKPVSMLTDRRGGTKKPLSLRQFREHLDTGGMYDAEDVGSCSCFVPEQDESEAA